MDSILNKSRKKAKLIFSLINSDNIDEIADLVKLNSELKKLELNKKILVGTHHKTGTMWLISIFKKISRKFDLKFFRGKQNKLPENFDIFLQDHSQFDFDKLPSEYRGIHLIRDPRDIIISGCFYHTKSQEKWLHIKREKFGGLTYQEKINSYSSLDDQIFFEMENTAFKAISAILDWDYNNAKFMNIKYEDLISDQDLLLFHQLFNFLGFSGKEISEILRITYSNSLFSGNYQRSTHIRSGKARQWEKYFKANHKAKFLSLYSDALIKLKYESNHNWVNM